MSPNHTALSDAQLITHLRQLASMWFKDADILVLEELIKRYQRRFAPRREANDAD